MTGEAIASSNFTVFGRGTVCIDPLNQQNIEFASFTGVDATNIALTGCVRGLSALSDTSSSARAKYHAATTPVIVTFGVHSISDLLTYINNAVSGSLGTATDTTAGSTKMSVNQSSLPRARSTLVSQQTSPNMTLLVQPFARAYRGGIINYAGGSTTTMVAPVSNPRYDLIVYSTVGAAIAVRTGTEGSSPQRPTPTPGDIVLCDVYHRVGETSILERNVSPNTQGYITIWYESDTYNSSSLITSDNVTNGGADQSQLIANAIQAVGQSNSTGNASIIAQSFYPKVPHISGVSLLRELNTGTFTGSVKIALQAATSGNPSGTDLASYTIPNTAWNDLGPTFSMGTSTASGNLIAVTTIAGILVTGQPVVVNTTTGLTGLTAGQLYYVVVSTSTSIGFATTLANAIAGTLVTFTGTSSNCTITPYPIVTATFGTEYESLVVGNEYFIVVTPSTSDSSNHPNLGINNAGGYPSGTLKYNNSSDGWVTVSTSILYFTTNEGVLAKVVQTDSNDGLIPASLSRYGLIGVDPSTTNTPTGTTAETTVFSRQFPAGLFTISSGIRVRVFGALSQANTATATFFTGRIKYNGVTLASYSASPSTSSGSNPIGLSSIAEIFIYNNGSFTSQIYWGLNQSWVNAASGSTATTSSFTGNTVSIITGTTAVDTSGPGALTITMQSNLTFTLTSYNGCVIEKIG